MKKMLKIMAMLLVIATVVFAAGCAEKTEETPEEVVDEETAPVAEEVVADGSAEEVVADADVVEEDADAENETV